MGNQLQFSQRPSRSPCRHREQSLLVPAQRRDRPQEAAGKVALGAFPARVAPVWPRRKPDVWDARNYRPFRASTACAEIVNCFEEL